jgi:hypothetical protein
LDLILTRTGDRLTVKRTDRAGFPCCVRSPFTYVPSSLRRQPVGSWSLDGRAILTVSPYPPTSGFSIIHGLLECRSRQNCQDARIIGALGFTNDHVRAETPDWLISRLARVPIQPATIASPDATDSSAAGASAVEAPEGSDASADGSQDAMPGQLEVGAEGDALGSGDTLPNLLWRRVPCFPVIMPVAVQDARAAAVDSNGPVLHWQFRHVSQIGVGRPPASVDEVAGDPGIQEEAPHSQILRSRSACSSK